jgi:hypothetical protein
MEVVIEEYLTICLSYFGHFSREPLPCAHGIGKSVDRFAKQQMVLAHVLMEANHFGTSS